MTSMTKQVIYSQVTGAVSQWQDTEKFHYAAPPDGVGILPVTDAQWAKQNELKWVRDGKLTDVAPAPVDPPKIVPSQVTPAQGLMALFVLKSITEDDILAAIASIDDATMRYQAQIAYSKAMTWERASQSMQTLAGLMSLTESDLDELFTVAATYTNL